MDTPSRAGWHAGGGAGLAALGLALATLLATSACTFTPAPGGRGTSAAEAAARSLMTAWEVGDTALLLDLFRPDAVYDDFPDQTQYRGIDEIVGYVARLHSWANSVTLSINAIHAADSVAFVEWLMSGVQDRPIPGLVPVATNRDFTLAGVTIVEMEQRRIARAADYVDMTPLLLQLGGRIEMPGGTVLRMDEPAEAAATPSADATTMTTRANETGTPR